MLNLTHKCKKHKYKNNELLLNGQITVGSAPTVEMRMPTVGKGGGKRRNRHSHSRGQGVFGAAFWRAV